jgi:hypothetical protein
MKKNSPIILFVYLRLEKLRKTIESLSNNYLASESDLIIFSDGAKNAESAIKVTEVRKYLKTISGFKTVTIHEANTNHGLANSVINGVNIVIKEYHKAIIVEDDLILSKNFLTFMNSSLCKYENNKKIYSISGYSFEILNTSIDVDGYFLNRPWSWGWATWEDRWLDVDWELSKYNEFKSNKQLVKEFSKLGSDVNSMLNKQMSGKLDSWLIRWTFHVFKQKGLVFYPLISKVDNNGWDLFATNTKGLKDRYKTQIDVSNNVEFRFPQDSGIIDENQKTFLKKMNFKARIINKFREQLYSILNFKIKK